MKTACFCAALCAPVFAGPWLPKPGSGSMTLGAAFLQALKVSDARGEARDYSLSEFGIGLGGEYGIFPWAALALSWNPFKAVWSDSADRNGIGDTELGLNLKLAKIGGHRLALRLAGRMPLGETNSGVPDYVYALHSQGVWAAELQPQWGWAGRGMWLQAGLGARLRSDGFAAQGIYHFSGGKALGAWSPRIGFSGLIPLDSRGNGKPSDQEQYYGWQAAVDRRLGNAYKIGLQFDGMFTGGQELPLGLRSNLYLGRKW